jgi:GAF domain-containing protein
MKAARRTWNWLRRAFRKVIFPAATWTLWRFVQLALIAAAAALAYYHAFPKAIHEEKTDYPNIDAVTLGCVGIAVIAILLPSISEITVGGTSLKLRNVEQGAEDVSDTLDDVANLVQNWSTAIGIFACQLQGATPATQNRLITQYYRDRIGEAQTFMSDDPDDVVRVALWMYNDAAGAKTIDYVWSNDFKPTKLSWQIGEGMIGKAYEEGRAFNESDVRVLPCYQSTRAGDPPYRAVLVQPVFLGDQKLGVITVDKRRAEIFNELAREVAKGLAAQCAIAYYLWEIA